MALSPRLRPPVANTGPGSASPSAAQSGEHPRSLLTNEINPHEHRARVAERLESRGSGRDRSAAAQQRRRLKEIANGNPATNRGAGITADQRGGQVGGRVAGQPWA